MNGRLYDPVVGRFLSPDPFVQDPSFSQSYNRYSYCLNNPLKFTDYSGEKWNWNNLNPFYHFQNFMQWVNDKTPQLRQNMVNAKVPNFEVNYNTMFGPGFSVGDNPAYYPFYENRIVKGQQGISNQISGFSYKDSSPDLHFGYGDIISQQSVGLEFYYGAVYGMVFNNGKVMSRDDFIITLNSDFNANARFLGFKDGKYHVNFDIGEYEVTKANVRALMIHEAYGHGVKGYSSNFNNHHKAYFASIDSRYWNATTLSFKQHNVDKMWYYFHREVGFKRMPEPYQSIYDKYIK